MKKGIQGENSLREEKEGNGTKEKESGMEEWRKRRKGGIEKRMQKWKGGGRKGGRRIFNTCVVLSIKMCEKCPLHKPMRGRALDVLRQVTTI